MKEKGLVEFTNFIKSQRRSGKENAPHQTDIHHENKIFPPQHSRQTIVYKHVSPEFSLHLQKQ